jgi:NodT family efflux transporter outer membrane factor (OMF) lipoprotein
MPRPHPDGGLATRPQRLAGALLALVLTTAASASTPPAPPSPDTVATPSAVRLPTTWQGDTSTRPADDAALAQWWQALGSPGLERLVLQALERHTEVRAAQATLRQVRAVRAAAEAGTGPSLGLGASSQRSRRSDSTANTHTLSANASWSPDLNGSQGAAVEAARADERAAEADLQSTRMAVAAEVGVAWVQWHADLWRRRLTEASLHSLEETLSLTRWNAQAGLASELEVQQARQSAETTRASLLGLDATLATDRHALALLAGVAPGQLPLQAEDSGLPGLTQALTTLSTGLPADLLRRRPDLRAAEAAVQAAWLRREQTRRAGWPGLSLSGTLGWQAASLAALSSSGAALATLAAAVDWTVFDGGERAALVEQKDALWEQSRIAYDAALLSALKDTEDQLAALRGASERQASLHAAAGAAEQALQLTQARRLAGLTDLSTLLEAQRSALTTELTLVSARADQALALIRTWKALGGGWSATAPAPQAPHAE